jgi:hypothetical protein
MNDRHLRPLPTRLAAPSAVTAAFWSIPALAQARDTTFSAGSATTFDRVDLARLLVIAVCGAVGAFAADLVTDGGRLERWKRDGDSWTLGFPGKLIVGSVAAMAFLALKLPTTWWQLIGAAIAAGVGAEAILLSIIATRKAEGAERARARAEEDTRKLAAHFQERLQTMKQAALAWDDDHAPSPMGATVAESLAFNQDPSPRGARSPRGTNMVALLADRFSAEVVALTGTDTRGRVLGILREVLNRDDVESDSIGKLGADSEEVLDMIIHRLAKEFPDSRPRFSHGDVSGTDTLDDIVGRVKDRQP